jgi:hypothetical protein
VIVASTQASAMAWRKEPAPLSALLATAIADPQGLMVTLTVISSVSAPSETWTMNESAPP